MKKRQTLHQVKINYRLRVVSIAMAMLCLCQPAQTKAVEPLVSPLPTEKPSAVRPDTIIVIQSPLTPAPDDIYQDESAVITETPGDSTVAIIADFTPEMLRSENTVSDLARLGDKTHSASIAEFAVPAGVFAAAALCVRTPKLVQFREYVQEHVSHHGLHKTSIDNYIQYAPMVVGYALDFTGYHSQHNLLDRTILLAMSYATFGVLNYAGKTIFKEQRPDSSARNSFPSGHTGTAFMGAEFLRREYWHRNKWIGVAGYVVAAGVGYMRIRNDRHWINDVVGGAALGYLSTTFAYWIYPKIFHKRTRLHRDELLQRLTPETAGKDRRVTLIAAPFASDGCYGMAASLMF